MDLQSPLHTHLKHSIKISRMRTPTHTEKNKKQKKKTKKFTSGFAANMTEKSSNFLHPHKLPTGGTESMRLEQSCRRNERSIIPKPYGVSDGRVPLGEQILKLIGLKVIRNGMITAILRPAFTLPPFVTELLSLHNLHQWLDGGFRIVSNHGDRGQKQKQNPKEALRIHCVMKERWVKKWGNGGGILKRENENLLHLRGKVMENEITA